MSDSNGTTWGGFAALAKDTREGVVRFAKEAPNIDDIVVPEIEDIVVPEIKIQINKARSVLQSVADRIKAKNNAMTTALEEQKRLRQKAIHGQKAEIRKFIVWMIQIALPGIRDIQSIVDQEGVGTELLEADASEVYPRDDDRKLTIGQQRNEWESKIEQYRKHKNPVIALPVIVAEAVFWLSVPVLEEKELLGELSQLVKDGLLQENSKGEVFALNAKRFTLGKRFDILEPEDKTELLVEIRDAVGNQAKRIRDEQAEAEKKFIAEFVSRGTIKVVDFLDGKSRVALIHETEDRRFQTQMVNGTCCFLTKDGGLLVEFDEDHIWVIDAFGRQRQAFLKLRDLELYYAKHNLKVMVDRHSFRNEEGLLLGEDTRLNIEFPREVATSDKGAWVNAYVFIWHACRSGILHENLDVRMQDRSVKPKVILVYRAINRQLTADQFHHKGEIGRYRMEFPEWTWDFRDGSGKQVFKNLKLEFERFEDNNNAIRLRVINFSPEHEQFLEKVACLSPDGYIDDLMNKGGVLFFSLIKKNDHAIKFPIKR